MGTVPEQPRRLIWLADTLDVLRRFAVGVRQKFGFALYQAQVGDTHETAKPMHGFGSPVWEVRADDRSGTYRVVYVVQLRGAVYVVHVFQKKAKSGASTPKRDLDLVKQRLKPAGLHLRVDE